VIFTIKGKRYSDHQYQDQVIKSFRLNVNEDEEAQVEAVQRQVVLPAERVVPAEVVAEEAPKPPEEAEPEEVIVEDQDQPEEVVEQPQAAAPEEKYEYDPADEQEILALFDVDSIEDIQCTINTERNEPTRRYLSVEPENFDLTLAWDLGDGRSSSGGPVDTTYDQVGTYYPSVLVIKVLPANEGGDIELLGINCDPIEITEEDLLANEGEPDARYEYKPENEQLILALFEVDSVEDIKCHTNIDIDVPNYRFLFLDPAPPERAELENRWNLGDRAGVDNFGPELEALYDEAGTFSPYFNLVQVNSGRSIFRVNCDPVTINAEDLPAEEPEAEQEEVVVEDQGDVNPLKNVEFQCQVNRTDQDNQINLVIAANPEVEEVANVTANWNFDDGVVEEDELNIIHKYNPGRYQPSAELSYEGDPLGNITCKPFTVGDNPVALSRHLFTSIIAADRQNDERRYIVEPGSTVYFKPSCQAGLETLQISQGEAKAVFATFPSDAEECGEAVYEVQEPDQPELSDEELKRQMNLEAAKAAAQNEEDQAVNAEGDPSGEEADQQQVEPEEAAVPEAEGEPEAANEPADNQQAQQPNNNSSNSSNRGSSGRSGGSSIGLSSNLVANCAVSSNEVAVGQTVTFSAMGSRGYTSFTIETGDGGSKRGFKANNDSLEMEHAFRAPGQYEMTLEVRALGGNKKSCAVDIEVVPGIITSCSDDIDNDNDGLVDFPDDPGCLSLEDDSETNVSVRVNAKCNDGIDNDGDGLIDLKDIGCENINDDSEGNPQFPIVANGQAAQNACHDGKNRVIKFVDLQDHYADDVIYDQSKAQFAVAASLNHDLDGSYIWDGYLEDGIRYFEPDEVIRRDEALKLITISNCNEDFISGDLGEEQEFDFQDAVMKKAVYWGKKYIFRAANMGIINKDDFVEPLKNIKRAEFMKMLVRLDNVNRDTEIERCEPNETLSADMNYTHWACDYAKTLIKMGVASGITDENGELRMYPNAPLTRANAAIWLNNYFAVINN
jgi:plastocyanin